MGDRYRSIEATVAVPSSGELLTFPAHYACSCPTESLLALSLSSCIYYCPLILCCPHHSLSLFLSPSSLSTAAISTVPRPQCRIFFHPYPPSLLSSVSDPAVLINLGSIHCRSHPPSVLHYPVSMPPLILVVIHIFLRIWCSLLSITFPRICCWCFPFLRLPLRPHHISNQLGRFSFQSGGGGASSAIPGQRWQHPSHRIESVECSRVLGVCS